MDEPRSISKVRPSKQIDGFERLHSVSWTILAITAGLNSLDAARACGKIVEASASTPNQLIV